MSKPRLSLLHSFSPVNRAWLHEKLGEFFEIIEPRTFDDAGLADCLRDADVAVCMRLSAALLSSARKVQMVQTPSTGVEGLDHSALATRGITVCKSVSHAPHVAEHAVAMLLALTRKIVRHDRLLRQGVWYRPQGDSTDGGYQSDTLLGATIGLVGYGAINQAVARILSGFGVKPLVCRRHSRSPLRNCDLSELMAKADAVIAAVPLTEETRGMIGPEELGAQSPSPYLVNVGRAEVIDRKALIERLESGQIRGVALDVPYEGIDRVAGVMEFTRFENTVISPHRAGTVRGCSPNLLDVVDNLISFAQGLPLKNVVDLRVGY